MFRPRLNHLAKARQERAATPRRDGHRWDLTILAAGVLILFWKMHGFKLPSQINAEALSQINELRVQNKRPALPAFKVHLIDSVADWLSPWRWRRGDLLKPSTPTGGDFGAHVWLPDFMKRGLLPKGRLTGWSNDFFAGFPAASFYFPLPHLTIALLSFLLPYGIAFKLVSVAGICSLPFATHRLGRMAGLAAPAPLFMGLAAFVFLLGRNYDLYIYGGSILPTMAGEFSFSISLSFGTFFLAQFVKLLRTGIGTRTTAILLAFTGLSHLLPTIFVVSTALIVLCIHTGKLRPSRQEAIRTLANALRVFVVAAMLAAWWIVPFASNLAYTNDMGWEKSTKYVEFLFPFLARKPPPDSQLVAVAFAFAIFGLLRAGYLLVRTDRSTTQCRQQRSGEVVIVALGIVTILAGVLFRFSPQHRLWNARILPFWFLATALLGAYGAASVPLGKLRSKSVAGVLGVLIACGLPLHIVPGWLPVPRHSDGLIGLQLARRSTDTNAMLAWTGHNFSGYENQPGWPEYAALMTEASRVGKQFGCGRAMWEHEEVRFNTYGTTLALMLLPYWTKGCIASLDGIYFESSATLPHHWITAALVSAPSRPANGDLRSYSGPTNPQRRLSYPTFDLQRGAEAMRTTGTRYFIAVTDETKRTADAMVTDFVKVGQSGPYVVYRILGSELVTAASEEPVVVTGIGESQTSGWLDVQMAQSSQPSLYPKLIASSGPKSWRRARAKVVPHPGVVTYGAGVSMAAVATRTRTLDRVAVTNIRQNNTDISFNVDRVGVPVVVHTSYHPNWHVRGAKGPYRLMPNVMVVVPTSKCVGLHYGYGRADQLGWLLTFAGVVLLLRRPHRHSNEGSKDGK